MQRQILHDQVLQANSHLDACSALKQIARIELDIEKKNFAKIEYRYTTTVVYETDDEGACESEAKEKKDGTRRWCKEKARCECSYCDTGRVSVSELSFYYGTNRIVLRQLVCLSLF